MTQAKTAANTGSSVVRNFLYEQAKLRRRYLQYISSSVFKCLNSLPPVPTCLRCWMYFNTYEKDAQIESCKRVMLKFQEAVKSALMPAQVSQRSNSTNWHYISFSFWPRFSHFLFFCFFS